MPKYQNRVSFALSAEHYEKLRERMTSRLSSENLVARAIVEERLNRSDEALFDALNLLSAELYKVGEAVKNNSETLEAMRTEGGELPQFRVQTTENIEQLGELLNDALDRIEELEGARGQGEAEGGADESEKAAAKGDH